MFSKRLDDQILILALVLQGCVTASLGMNNLWTITFWVSFIAFIANVMVIILSRKGLNSWRTQSETRKLQMHGHIVAYESCTESAHDLVIQQFKETTMSLDQVCRIVGDANDKISGQQQGEKSQIESLQEQINALVLISSDVANDSHTEGIGHFANAASSILDGL